MFEIILICILSLYLIQSIILLYGALKKFPNLKKNELPSATVIVAARNEEDSILRCLKSLDQLDYPGSKLSIIIVDDHSTDNTGRIIDDFIQSKPRFRKVSAAPETDTLKGKANAIHTAVLEAEGEIILTTDADCAVSAGWAITIASYYTENTGAVFGYTGQKADSIFGGIQHLDFMYLLTVAAGSINLNKPLSCIGNNMSYRKSAYYEAGGYPSIPFSVTEDFELLFAIDRLGTYALKYPLDKSAYVESMPCVTVKQLYRQKVRWGRGGLNSPLRGFVVMITGFLASLAILLLPFYFTLFAAALAALKFITDFIFLFIILRGLNRISSLFYFVFFELYFIFYVLVLPAAVVFQRKIIWKERKY